MGLNFKIFGGKKKNIAMSESTSTPNKIATDEHCAYCFDMLLEELTNASSGFDWSCLPLSKSKMPVFVTWYKQSTKRKQDELRGCLGTFSQELPIGVGLRKYAIMSAVNDKRFEPMSIDEIPSLKCSISLLHSFVSAKAWNDWEIGIHGITIQFSTSHKKKFNATYLPEVASQQNWSKLVTIENLINKAGFDGNLSEVENLRVTKYQSCKAIMTWTEYLKYAELSELLKHKIESLRSFELHQVKKLKQSKSSKARTKYKGYHKKTRMKSAMKSTKTKTEKVLRFGSKSQLSSPSPPFYNKRKRKYDDDDFKNNHCRFKVDASPSPSASISSSSVHKK